MHLLFRAAARHASCVAALALAGVLTSVAHAGRPLQTEDAGVLERGAFELESFVGWLRADGEPTERTAALQLGRGFGATTQLALQLVRAEADTERATQVNITGKTALRAVASMPFAGLTVHANLGHARDRLARESTTLWALAAEHSTAPGLDLMIETFADDRDRDPWINAGLRYTAIADRLFLDASYGRQAAAAVRG